MTGAERIRRYRLKHGLDKPVTKVTKHVTEPRNEMIDALKTHIRELEAQLARRNAEIAQERKQREIQPSTTATAAAAAKGEPDDQMFKLVRMLSSDNDGEVLSAARILVRKYDLRALME
jgi:flagellar biosynthesis/type III secretory pathway protein FliH